MAVEPLVIVTGGTSGIGLEVATLLCERGGLRVVICGSDRSRGGAAREALARRGLFVEFVPVDASNPVSVYNLVEVVEKTNKSILDVVGAGVGVGVGAAVRV